MMMILVIIYWEGIKFAAKVSKHFDFEGSMIENIERFCRSFTEKFTVRDRVS